MTRISRTFADLEIGQSAAITRVVTAQDLVVFAHVSGNMNPLNLPGSPGDHGHATAPAPSMWVGSLFSAVLGNLLPGPGTLYEAQTVRFSGRAHVGDTLTVRVEVTGKRPPQTVVLATKVHRGEEVIAEGVAEVRPPDQRAEIADGELPGITVARMRHVERLLAACRDLPPMRTAVVAPEEPQTLLGAVAGARAGLIVPVLVGEPARIRATAAACGADLTGCEIDDVAGNDAAAARAVDMVRQGRVAALIQGDLHTDTLLRHVMKSSGGLRGGRRISHVYVLDAPAMPDILLVTDPAINIAPALDAKVDIVQNAIDVALALGIVLPRVGILAAVETVNPKMPSTLEAAALSKMAERGQIRGAIVDGPLAMDNAISLLAARSKGLHSKVAGRADILVAPNLEAANILAKHFTFIAQAEGAGLVVGAKAPILLTSRSDGERTRLFSCAVALLYSHWQDSGRSTVAPSPTRPAEAAE